MSAGSASAVRAGRRGSWPVWWAMTRRTVTVLSRRLARRLAQAWSSSLQLRVAATTLVVSSTVVLLIGTFLVDQISAGILRAKRSAAIAQAQLGLPTAQTLLGDPEAGDIAGILDAIDRTRLQLSANGGSAGLFTIVIRSPSAAANAQLDPSTAPVSPALRRDVQRGNLVVQYVTLLDQNGGPQSGLMVGEPVPARAGTFELYYVFPLASEQQTIALVQRTVALSGLALVLLVLGIALLVTRQVVRPVRVAAETAGRLSEGDLAQRIRVHGNDDIARLGRSFNNMAESLQRQIRRLEELSRVQRRFTSDVSHELRTPLTTIRMATELLHEKRGEFPPALARSVELLNDELDRFESLLADLLEISRHDAGAVRLEADTYDLRGVVGDAVASSRMLAERHGSEIVISAPDDALPVDIDPRRIERILRNLLANALDHGDGKAVEVTVAGNDTAVAVTVRDHGVGLRPGEAGLVFNRFWRGDPSRSRLTGGTGLGLAISLEDARLHGGWLQAWGERGRGANFRLTLPRVAGSTVTESPLPLDPDEETSAEHGTTGATVPGHGVVLDAAG